MRYILKLILVFILLALGGISEASQVERIENQIEQIRGYKVLSDAHLASLIVKVSLKHGLDPSIVTALIGLESMFKVNAYNKRTKDYGLMQINEFNVKALKLDKARLLLDAEYNLEAGGLILKQMKKQFAKREPFTWVCRYNVGTRRVLKQSQIKICELYNSKINGFYLAGQ